MYTRTASPSDGLRKVVRYIMQLYGPCWFSFKKASKFTLGPALLFKQMQLIKTQPEDVQETVMPVMQQNAYMAEPGVIFCFMLESSTTTVRYKALEVIKKLKAKPNKKPRAKWTRGVHPLKVPTLQCTLQKLAKGTKARFKLCFKGANIFRQNLRFLL